MDEKVYILSPKSFYFFLPLIFRRIKFYAICINNINNFNEIYSLLDKNKISIKVNNLAHLISHLRIILKKNVSSKKLIYNLKKLGNAILHSSLIEIKKFIKQSEIKKT